MKSEWEFKHVGMVVSDIMTAVGFYEGLGFKAGPIRELAIDAGDLMVNGEPNETLIELAICDLERAGVVVELIQPISGEFVHMESLKNEGEGVNHLFFVTTDFESEKNRMIEEGFTFIFGGEGFAFFETRSVGNVLIELGQKTYE